MKSHAPTDNSIFHDVNPAPLFQSNPKHAFEGTTCLPGLAYPSKRLDVCSFTPAHWFPTGTMDRLERYAS